jgi:hypothetical protein
MWSGRVIECLSALLIETPAENCPHPPPAGVLLFVMTSAAVGSDEQIFGANEQVLGQGQRHLRSIRLNAIQQSGKGRILLRAVLPTCPGRQLGWGLSRGPCDETVRNPSSLWHFNSGRHRIAR